MYVYRDMSLLSFAKKKKYVKSEISEKGLCKGQEKIEWKR